MSFWEFITRVEMSDFPHILLEGSQDKAFFSRLHETVTNVVIPKRISIVSAEEISSDGAVLGNREKVARLVSQEPFGSRFVGFVDRELRGFGLREAIVDELRTHRCEGRLVWSRGHSIENYMFEFDTVKQALLDCAANEELGRVALGVLQEQFPQIMVVGCALGLTGVECGQLSVVRRTIHHEHLQIVEDKLCWDIDAWARTLKKRSNLAENTRHELVDGFRRWLSIAEKSTPEDVRWACDGHIGWNLIWAAYARVIFNTASSGAYVNLMPAAQRDAVLRVHRNIRFNLLARNWAQAKGNDTDDSPLFCLFMAGILST